MRRLLLFLLCATLAPRLALGIIVGPYAPDSSTLHLWHMDAAAVPVPDAVSPGGTNLTALANGATLGNPSYAGYGTAVSTVDGGTAGTNFASAIDAYLAPLALANGAADNIAWSFADPLTGAFTFEALVRIDFDPALNMSTVANGGNGRNLTMQILSGEQDSSGGGVRSWQFRLVPVGVTSGTSDSSVCRLEFINVNNGTSVQNIITSIPTTGPDAIVSNGWYHIAVTYNGNQGTADNLKIYWTAVDPARTEATLLLSTQMNLDLIASGAVDLAIGNVSRTSPNNNFIGLIDEVRISKVARSAGGMMFAPANVTIETHPSDQFVAVGDTVALSCAASGGLPLFYQWQLYGTNLPSATNISLVISNITVAQAGPYQVVVTNSTSSKTSNPAMVKVGQNMNELFNTGVNNNRLSLPGGSVDPHWQMVQSEDPSYPGPNAVVISTPAGTWLANTTNSVWIGPTASGNALGGNYTYQTSFLLDTLDPANAQLTVNWAVDNIGVDVLLNGVSQAKTNGGFTAFTSAVLTSGFVAGSNTVTCIVSNLPGSGANLTGLRAELKGVAMPLPPTAINLVGVPSNVSVTELHDVNFTVTAVGSGPLTYQWYHGATPVPGGTNRVLQLTRVLPADGGTYTVYVTNSLGFTNVSAQLNVTTPAALAWTGLNTSDWDTLTVNWRNTASSADVAFAGTEYVRFDSLGQNQPNVNLVQGLTPNGIVVDATTDYALVTYGMNGWLEGVAGITKRGTGTFRIEVTNNTTGPILIEAGVLQVGNYSTIGSLGSGPVTNNAALAFNRGDALPVPNTITGSGVITNIGGTTQLSGSNSYSGLTVVSGGVLSVRNGSALGTTSAGTVVGLSGQLFFDANIDVGPEPLTLSGMGPGDGALRKGGAGLTAFTGPITLDGDATIKVDGGSTLRLTNAAGITTLGAGLTLAADANGVGQAYGPIKMGASFLTKSGAGTWQLLSTANAGTGTYIQAGTLQLGNGLMDGNLPTGTVTNDGTLTFFGTNDQTILNEITGVGGVVQAGSNTTTLPIANSYTNVTSVNGGTLLVTHNNALGTTDGHTFVTGNFGAVSRVAFSGNLTVPEPFLLAARQPGDVGEFAAHLINLSGTNTLTGPITVTTGGNQYTIESATGLLVCAGNYSQVSGTGDRFLKIQGAGNGLWSGAINDGTARVNVAKRGPGTWTLAGSNSYSGPTIVAGGTLAVQGYVHTNTVTVQADGKLAGTGMIMGATTVQAGGTLSPGVGGIGALTISNTLTLLAGSTNVFDVNASLGTKDEVVGLTSVTYGGTLVVNNLGGTLTTSSAFQLFSAGAYSGAFAGIVPATPGAGLAWNTNTLPTDGTLRVTSGLPTTPTNLTAVVVGTTLDISWPPDYQGWKLQGQTNAISVGLNNAWVDVPGSTATNRVILNINPANGAVFYRLALP